MSSEPESLVLQLLRDMRAEIGDMRGDMADMRSVMATKDELRSLRADVASNLIAMEARQAVEHKQAREQIVGLRRAVIEYHTSVIGHGILISELEARVPPPGAAPRAAAGEDALTPMLYKNRLRRTKTTQA